ncbi:hypothetical protein ACBQ16_03765 [Halopseudomonas bauzanensis]|uniref:hypothetical protein n=1 Tax=Halopseudomonas bauzanensis TaxID=653930 RepID=UPI003524CDCD
MTTLNIADYHDLLQQAATLFLNRNQAQHLGNEQALFSRAVAHLVDSFTTSQATAENIVSRAYGEVKSGEDHRYMDISSSTSKLAMLVDPKTGIHHAVPVAMIFQQLIDTPARRRLRSVN